jgi:cytochrome b561
MLTLQRSLVVTFSLGTVITGLYILWLHHGLGNGFGRSLVETALGIFGFAAILASALLPGRSDPKSRSWSANDPVWHMSFGNLAVLLILLHSGFHLRSVVPLVAFACLGSVAVSGIVGAILSAQTKTPNPSHGSPTESSRRHVLERYWLSLHVILTAVCLALSLLHVLVILYY